VTAAARWPRRCVIHGGGCKVPRATGTHPRAHRAPCVPRLRKPKPWWLSFVPDRQNHGPCQPLTRQQKITLGEMRGSGVRDVLVYCSDYRCSNSITISADQWSNDVRLSDIEPQFICHAAREAPTSAPIGLRPKLTHENRRPVVASCDLLCPSLLPCDPYHSHGRCCG
jgi:hypothetical protein